MISIIFLFISLSLNVCFCLHIRSYCGHPGLPAESIIYQVDPDRNRFNDGDVIRYRCSNSEFHTHKQTRKCVAGRWVGKTARCGVPINDEVKSVKAFDCNHIQNNTIRKKVLDVKINQTVNPLRLTNSFHASRIMSGPIKANGSSCYLWKIELERPTTTVFVTIDFATEITEKDRDANSSILSKKILTVYLSVSPFRNCSALYSKDHISNDPEFNTTFLLRGFYFRCDSISEKDYLIESSKQPKHNLIQVETRADYERDVHLVALFLAKHKLNMKNKRPDCGRPEAVMTGVNHREIFSSMKNIFQFQVQCNDSFIDVTPNKPFDRKTDYWYTLNCSVNGLWEGQFPLCVPNIQCPGLEYLNQNKEESVFIESIENVYYVNASHWVAGEHSYVNFACSNPEHIVVGKLVIICMKNGKWSSNMPKCSAYVRPESLSTVAHSPWTVIAILTILLLAFLSIVLLIVRKYVKNMRKELMRYRNKSRHQNSIYTDIKTNSINFIYDDCDSSRLTLNSRVNRSTKKGFNKFKYETEYIELEETHRQMTNASTEPLYIPILPPTQ